LLNIWLDFYEDIPVIAELEMDFGSLVFDLFPLFWKLNVRIYVCDSWWFWWNPWGVGLKSVLFWGFIRVDLWFWLWIAMIIWYLCWISDVRILKGFVNLLVVIVWSFGCFSWGLWLLIVYLSVLIMFWGLYLVRS
jgi:hypothetical protein